MTISQKKKLAKSVTTLILIVIGGFYQLKTKNNNLDTSQVGYYDVVSIADGDTITVDMEGKKEKVRFIGVDTPEIYHGGDTSPSECYGEKAKAYIEAAIDNKRVKLVADEKGSNRDKYGRLLRYVYNYQNLSLDETLVSEGYGFAVDGFAYSKKQEYLSLMNDAENNKKGLWAICKIDRSKGYPEVAN
ncbi:MAG: thermonuclease family protein [Candidatus Nomurabacteria bacterium]|nr:MAG: thermonuclease family protein [Candidatus Nomurabacteria bacterium]HRV75847.1 thermonuclease family protein [Candidatus Saccharimonadales bacterium]